MAETTSRQYVVPSRPRGSVFGEPELDALRELLEGDETLSCGRQRDAFEAEFKERFGGAFAVAVSSCTVGLELATHLAGIEPGSVVIATPQTYQATLNPLLDLDVEVRFCDIDPNTLCLDADKLRDLVCPRVRAIFLTHYGGLSADMQSVLEIANERGICVIEDCAHALGALYEGKTPGTFGHIGVFSFQSMKNISTLGQGGMIVVQRPDRADTLRRLIAVEPDAVFAPRDAPPEFARFGIAQTDLRMHEKNAYTHDCRRILRRGTNSTLGEAAAAVGRVQLNRLSALVESRRTIASRLDDALRELPGVRVQCVPHGQSHGHHRYTFFVDPDAGLNRNDIASAIDEAGVEIQLRYFPLHLLPEWRYRGGRLGSCPVAEEIWFRQQVNLPIYPSMRPEQVAFTIDAVREVIARAHAAA